MTSRGKELAEELAIVFKLDDEQFEASKGRRTGVEGLELVLKLMEETMDDLLADLTPFCSIYLPRFMEAFLEVISKVDGSYMALAALLSAHPLFGRWIRENDPLAVTVILMQAYADAPLTLILTKLPLPLATTTAIETIARICTVIYAVNRLLPDEPSSSSELFPLPLPLQKRVDAKLEFQNNQLAQFEARFGRQLSQQQQNEVDRVLRCLGPLQVFVCSTSPKVWREQWLSRERRVLWWKCEYVMDAGHVSCVNLREGEDMMCGRCEAVRYCSQGHQLAHWESHKRYCKRAKW